MSKIDKPKLIKDVVHGYIELEPDYIMLIDTPQFQRLKNIRQTSYAALYPSSSHDRFSHSLGVFALGKYAFDCLKKNIVHDYPQCATSLDNQFWDDARSTFLSACLLHDVGHAPFSHTSEEFFRIPIKNGQERIRYDLMKIVDDETFSKDFLPDRAPKPHEIMSATIGIELLDRFESKVKDFKLRVDKSLFARMITGIKYADENSFINTVYNALISLLNSDVIDVDRLDYVMRDAMMTGYQSVSIDTKRLLSSVCLVTIPPDHTKYTIGFYKNAISIIENVVIAHDLERRWIQSHSAIAYETILLQQCIKEIESSLTHVIESEASSDKTKKADDEPDANRIFRQEALTKKGVLIQNGGGFMDGCTVRLLCDSDILFLAKQLPEDNKSRKMIDEYFDRSSRKKAIWKTEIDFDNIMRNLGDDNKDKYLFVMDLLFGKLNFKNNNYKEDFLILNEDTKAAVKEEYDKKRNVENLPSTEKSQYDNEEEAICEVISIFENACQKCGFDLDLVVKKFNKFSSGTAKLDSNNIYIKFGKDNNGTLFNNLLNTYRLKNNENTLPQDKYKNNIYYIYCDRDKEIEPVSLIHAIIAEFDEYTSRNKKIA